MRQMTDDDDLDIDADDPEVDALNEQLGEGEGFYSRNMEGDVCFYSSPDSERCGGHGSMDCYCGGDFCVCGNQGHIECMGCEDCAPYEGDDDWYPDDDR